MGERSIVKTFGKNKRTQFYFNDSRI